MAQAHYISESDAQILRQMAADYRRRVGNTTGRGRRDGIEDEESNAPEVYIARIPDGGITALDENVTGTGTGPPLDDVASSAECSIYRLLDDGTGTGLFEPVDGLSKRVYNLSPNGIEGNQWLPVIRDKFGVWVPTGQTILEGLTVNWRGARSVSCSGGTLTVTYDTLVFEDGLLVDILLNT